MTRAIHAPNDVLIQGPKLDEIPRYDSVYLLGMHLKRTRRINHAANAQAHCPAGILPRPNPRYEFGIAGTATTTVTAKIIQQAAGINRKYGLILYQKGRP